MALDGICLAVILNELRENYIGARVEKISQPSRDTVIISLRCKAGNKKLLISSAAVGARLHFTEKSPENPQTPPMFCMLMRKHLTGGRLTSVRQMGFDRVVFLDFEVLNELADPVTFSLCIEIMGHNSNIILINEKGVIADAIRRVNADVSSVRFVLPGVKYTLPPEQNKKDIFSISDDEFVENIKSCGDMELSRALLSLYSGFSPIVCREFAYFCSKNADIRCDELLADDFDKLKFFLIKFKGYYENPEPCVINDLNRSPKDFSFLPIRQYGHSMLCREFDSLHTLLDEFYTEKDRIERIKQKSGDLLKTVVNISDRITRKLANQKKDLEKCRDKEVLRKKGDIIYANLNALQKGMTTVRLPDFYDENGGEIEIALDFKLTPVQNAQKYYNDYRKADTAEKMLTELIKSGKEELIYIESVFDALTRASTDSELTAIRQELYEGRYIRKSADKKAIKVASPYLKYRSSDGFLVLCGRNNFENDKLTLKDSAKGDIWLHTKDIPGSHTVVVTEGKEVPDRTLTEAACLAAYNSRARNSSKVAVDYTAIKNVKKPSGAKPGMVIYEVYKTAIVTPDSDLAERLSEK